MSIPENRKEGVTDPLRAAALDVTKVYVGGRMHESLGIEIDEGERLAKWDWAVRRHPDFEEPINKLKGAMQRAGVARANSEEATIASVDVTFRANGCEEPTGILFLTDLVLSRTASDVGNIVPWEGNVGEVVDEEGERILGEARVFAETSGSTLRGFSAIDGVQGVLAGTIQVLPSLKS